MGFVPEFMPVNCFLKGFPFWLSKFDACASEGEIDALGGSSLSKVFLWLSLKTSKDLYLLAYGSGFVEDGEVWFFAEKNEMFSKLGFCFWFRFTFEGFCESYGGYFGEVLLHVVGDASFCDLNAFYVIGVFGHLYAQCVVFDG